MKLRFPILVVVIAFAGMLGGCRQSDGPSPQAANDTSNRIEDLSRDLLAVSRGEASAEQDFADDLKSFAITADAEAATDKLARRVAATVKGIKLSDQAADQLAQTCWTTIAGREFSERQMEQVQADYRTQLSAAGVAQPAVDALVADVATTQRAISIRPRRWYEVF